MAAKRTAAKVASAAETNIGAITTKSVGTITLNHADDSYKVPVAALTIEDIAASIASLNVPVKTKGILLLEADSKMSSELLYLQPLRLALSRPTRALFVAKRLLTRLR